MEISDAERERRRALAKELHAKGKFGGPQKGSGRPKNARAQEVVAEQVRRDASNIVAALRDALNNGKPNERLKAALAMLDIETKETELKIKEEQRAYDNFSKERLIGLVEERLAILKKAGIDLDNPDAIINSTAKELQPEQIANT